MKTKEERGWGVGIVFFRINLDIVTELIVSDHNDLIVIHQPNYNSEGRGYLGKREITPHALHNHEHIVLKKRYRCFILCYCTFFDEKLYSSAPSYFWYLTIIPIKRAQLHHSNAESDFCLTLYQCTLKVAGAIFTIEISDTSFPLQLCY